MYRNNDIGVGGASVAKVHYLHTLDTALRLIPDITILEEQYLGLILTTPGFDITVTCSEKYI